MQEVASRDQASICICSLVSSGRAEGARQFIVRSARPEATAPRSGRHWLSDKANGFGVFEPGLDRSDDGANLDREQLDADQRYSHECVDDDALVEDAVDDLGET